MRIFRKGIVCIVTVAMLTSLAACGKKAENGTVNETTPTETATPTTTPEATPTETVAPTATPEVTPEITGAITPVVYDSRECWLTMTASKEWDPRVVGDISIVHLVNNEEEKLFCASDYANSHRSEWEADASARIAALHKQAESKKAVGTESTDLVADEKLECVIDIGDWGIVEMYSNAVSYVRFGEYANSYTDYFAVICRSVSLDGSQKYAVLYEKKSENLGSDGSVSRSIRINPTYTAANGESAGGLKLRKVVTEISYVESTGEDVGSRTFTFAGYFTSNADGTLSELLRWRNSREETTEWPYVIGGALYDAEGRLRYDQDIANWKILSYNLSVILNSLYDVANGGKPTVSGITIKDGVFSEKEALNDDWSLCAEAELRSDDVVVRFSLQGQGAEIQLDEVRRMAYDWSYAVTSQDGDERLQTSVLPYNYASESELAVKDNAVPELTVRYFPVSSEKPTQVFEPEVFLAQNSSLFEKNTVKYQDELEAEYRGEIVYRTNLLKEVPLGAFGSILVYETAAYGETPKQVGSTVKMYRYEVSYLLLGSHEVEAESILYEWNVTTGQAPQRAEDFLVINHAATTDMEDDSRRFDSTGIMLRTLIEYVPEAFPEERDSRIEAAKEDVMTIVCLGRRFGESENGADDAEYYVNKVYVDAAGKRVIDHFDTQGKQSSDARVLGSEIRDASGKIDFTYLNASEIEFMSHPMRQIAAAFIENGADYSLRITEEVPYNVSHMVRSNPPQYLYIEGTSFGDGYKLYGLVSLTNGRTYQVYFGLVKEDRLILIEEEEFLLADLEDK